MPLNNIADLDELQSVLEGANVVRSEIFDASGTKIGRVSELQSIMMQLYESQVLNNPDIKKEREAANKLYNIIFQAEQLPRQQSVIHRITSPILGHELNEVKSLCMKRMRQDPILIQLVAENYNKLAKEWNAKVIYQQNNPNLAELFELKQLGYLNEFLGLAWNAEQKNGREAIPLFGESNSLVIDAKSEIYKPSKSETMQQLNSLMDRTEETQGQLPGIEPQKTNRADTSTRLILDYVFDHEAQQPNKNYLTQPIGGGKTVDYTWGQVCDQARRMAAHLKAQGFPRGARIAILSKNCAHFIFAELAIWMAGYTTVAIFPTESSSTISYVLGHSEASLLFVGKLDTWETQKVGVPEGMPCITFPLAPIGAAQSLRNNPTETWEAVMTHTAPLQGRPERSADELAMLLYTSGSTGVPKGVMNSFGAITRVGEGIRDETIRQISVELRVLSYLPLAHSYERSWIEVSTLVAGDTHIYFAESQETFLQDLKRARPTLFISVPRLWLKFQQRVFEKIPPTRLDWLLSIPILGKIVAKKVLKGLGLETVVMAGSGSAPLPKELIQWYRRIGLNLLEGYGMSEDNSYSYISSNEFNEPGYVGVPMKGVEVKLTPEGEILIKSPGQFSGYYKQPELTAECFTEDGFFRTGDRGEIRADGMLKITGRIKELFKTSKGKYIAPSPIENKINAHPMVELSVVSGTGKPVPYAMVVLDEALRMKLSDASFRAEIEREMTDLLQRVNAELAHWEKLHMIVILREPWSIENGTLTPTMKVKRAPIEKVVEKQVNLWYDSGKQVYWT